MTTGNGCHSVRESLDALVDAALTPAAWRDVEHHLAGCAECSRERDAIDALRAQLKEHLVRYTAPDVLKARVRAEASRLDAATPEATRRRWPIAIAAGVLIAAASSGLTFAVTRSSTAPPITNELLTSHIRSLMPGHLTDVASSNQHNVKPWFNGRVDMSPTVPDLSSNGFPLVGGRLDYVNGRAVPVIVYSRRSHLINVYEWPAAGGMHFEPRNVNGYNLVEWYRDGIEYWAVSDVNEQELNSFVRLFASPSS